MPAIVAVHGPEMNAPLSSSGPAAIEPLALPALSSLKSSDASPTTNPVAEATAQQTFASRPPLPFESPGGRPAMLADQRRLSDVFFIKFDHLRPDPQQPRKTLDPQKQKELPSSLLNLPWACILGRFP